MSNGNFLFCFAKQYESLLSGYVYTKFKIEKEEEPNFID